MGWQPIAEGPLADRVRAAVRDIAAVIDDAVPPAQQRPLDLALMWAYVAGVFDDETSARHYDRALDAMIERLESGFGTLGLYSGLAHAGWVLAHVSDTGHEVLDEIDDALLAALESPWDGDFDLIQGLVGFGVYFLERLSAAAPATKAAAGLAAVVRQVRATAQTTAAGTTWFTRPELLPPWQREAFPEGYYNCGVAHGVPGVLALLGRVAARPGSEEVHQLVSSTADWIRAQRLPDGREVGRFPSTILPTGRANDRARTAWCYGDLGIAAAGWATALRTGASADEWIALAADCARRPAGQCRISDVSVCHGTFGMVHLLNRFYQASGDELFRDAACQWLERGLAARQQGGGVAGFISYDHRPSGSTPRQPVASQEFLEGASGIALVLLATLGGEEPGWDRRLLCDIPSG